MTALQIDRLQGRHCRPTIGNLQLPGWCCDMGKNDRYHYYLGTLGT